MTSSSTKLKEPSILLASANCHKLIRNLRHILSVREIRKLQDEVNRNVAGLLRLGFHHLQFARAVPAGQWRQKISRLYYAALNTKRGVALSYSGKYFTDVTDHQTIGELPEQFPRSSTYGTRLQNLRHDRNLADYSHVADESDLVISIPDAQCLVEAFYEDAKHYVTERGVSL